MSPQLGSAEGLRVGSVLARRAYAGTVKVWPTVRVLTGAGNLTTLAIPDSSTSNFLLPVPASAAVGDVMVAICVSQSSSTVAGAWSVPTGWVSRYESPSGRRTLIATYSISDAAALTALGSTAEIRPNSAWSATNRGAHVMFRVRGVDLHNPWAGMSAWRTGNTTTLSVPAWSSFANAGVVIATTGNNNSAGTPTPDGMWSGASVITKFQAVHPTLGSFTGIFAGTRRPLTATTSRAADSITLSPAASANLYGLAFALKASRTVAGEHSVWADAAPPGNYSTFYTDGSPSIITGNAFYRYGTGTSSWEVTGARVWVTSAVLAAATSVTLSARVATGAGDGPALAAMDAAAIRTVTVPVTRTGWAQGDFAPIVVGAGERVIVTVSYGGAPTGYQHSGTIPDDSVVASDGSEIALAHVVEGRSYYKIGSSPAASGGNAAYGVDVVFSEAA